MLVNAENVYQTQMLKTSRTETLARKGYGIIRCVLIMQPTFSSEVLVYRFTVPYGMSSLILKPRFCVLALRSCIHSVLAIEK